tara:strand:- start:527 stop:1231 length:705 start_codon:yes stop_codon:yes gene_type:complete
MKWIGQHIWDFISRFRSDVYLESTDTGTIASGGNLGLDANNKIVKANTGDALSFSGSTANGVLTYKDADEIRTSSTLTYLDSAALLSMNSSVDGFPRFQITNSHAGINPSLIQFIKSAVGADGDRIGEIDFFGDDEGGGAGSYCGMRGEIADATPGDESGRLYLQSVCNGSTRGIFIEGIGDGTSAKVDVNIAYGAASTTTIAGKVKIANIPTSDPSVAGEIWSDSGTLKISAG